MSFMEDFNFLRQNSIFLTKLGYNLDVVKKGKKRNHAK